MTRSSLLTVDYDWEQVVPELGYSAKELVNGQREAFEIIHGIILWTNVWDDLIDGDPVSHEEINSAFVGLSHDFLQNWFWLKHREQLNTMWTVSISAWLVSNRFEDEGQEADLNLAHVLRYMPAQLCCLVVVLAQGSIAKAMRYLPSLTRSLYNEDLEAYKAEVRARRLKHAV